MFNINSRTAALVSVVRVLVNPLPSYVESGVFRQYVRAQERLAEKLRQVSNRQTETSQPDGSADAIDPPTIATLMAFTLRIIARAACSDTYGYLKSPHQQLPITSRRSRH